MSWISGQDPLSQFWSLPTEPAVPSDPLQLSGMTFDSALDLPEL
jgi:hypothetical protein